jgi:hypothetical protein
MKPHVVLWWRAFTIVCCTATNVTQIANGHYVVAFFTGGLLSWIWWSNSRTAAHSGIAGGQAAYALGAACGTLCGMWIGRTLG